MFIKFNPGQNTVIDGTVAMPVGNKAKKIWRINKLRNLVESNPGKPLHNIDISRMMGFKTDSGFIALRLGYEFNQVFDFERASDGSYIYTVKDNAPSFEEVSAPKPDSRQQIISDRIETLKKYIRSKPVGTKINNEDIARLFGVNPLTVIAFKKKPEFQRAFTLSQSYGRLGYVYTINEDVKLAKTFTPTYTPPVYETEADDAEVVKTLAEEPADTAGDDAVSTTPSSFGADTLLALAKDAALTKLAKEMTVGELMAHLNN